MITTVPSSAEVLVPLAPAQFLFDIQLERGFVVMSHVRFFLLCAFGAAILALAACHAGQAAEPTIIFLVRHAEKASGSGDVPLSDAGKARSEVLRGIIGPLRPGAIYVTDTVRARETAQPTGKDTGLDLKVYNPQQGGWHQTLLKEAAGKTILVVGHTNTIPELIKPLTGVQLTIGEHEFDNLFIISIDSTGAHLVRLRYGKAT